METVLQRMISEILKIQYQEFNKGNSDNPGASIDAALVVHKLVNHDRYRGNQVAFQLMSEIELKYKEHFKYAKSLSKFTTSGAYHVVRKALIG